MASPDDGLREAVTRALAADPETVALDVRVGVLNAGVHLGGWAPSVYLWQRAQAVAAGVAGVRGVVNRIEAPGAPSPSRVVSIRMGERGGETE
jgi:osmotically-inducible protein OsmY